MNAAPGQHHRDFLPNELEFADSESANPEPANPEPANPEPANPELAALESDGF